VKLNFWQWLAVALLVIGGAWMAYDYLHKKDAATPVPAAQPTTQTTSAQ
jgi:hypothetical protein